GSGSRFTGLEGHAQQVSRELADAAAFGPGTRLEARLERGLEEELGACETVPSSSHQRCPRSVGRKSLCFRREVDTERKGFRKPLSCGRGRNSPPASPAMQRRRDLHVGFMTFCTKTLHEDAHGLRLVHGRGTRIRRGP